MFARVAVPKDSSQTKPAETVRGSRFEYSTQQFKSPQPEFSNLPKFSWNFCNIATHAPNESNQLSSGRAARSRAPQHAALFPWPMQAKLEVGAADHPLEREADQVAEQVIHMPDALAVADPAMRGDEITGMQRQCSCGGTCVECSGEQTDREHVQVQRTPTGPQVSRLGQSPTSSGTTAPPIVHEVLNSSGQPLDSATRAFMEPRFGFDFSSVRLHTGGAARSSTAEVGAMAYTVGRHVVLREESPSHQLLAHELAHVVQQRAGTTLIQRSPSPDKRYATSVSAARYRGHLMAQRILHHGLLSEDARAKINEELQFFTEDPAKDAYLREIKPALNSVNPIEMPTDYVNLMHGRPKKPADLIAPLNCGPVPCFDDAQIEAPRLAAQQKEQEEKDAARQSRLRQLKALSYDWRPEDQAAAMQQLDIILQANLNPDTRGVSDKDLPLLHARLERELRDTDAARLAACAKGDIGLWQKIQGRGNGDDPCISWFAPEGNHHGPETLNQLDRELKLHREGASDAVNQVNGDFFQYRLLSDPLLIEYQQWTMAALGVLTDGVGAFNEHVNAPSRPPGAPVPPKPPPPDTPALSGPTHVLQGGATNPGISRAPLGVVDDGNVIRPVTPRRQQDTQPAVQPAPQQQRQKIAVGGGAPPPDNQINMAKRPRTPQPDIERHPQPPSANDVLKGPQTISDQVDDLDRVSNSSDKSKKGSKNPDEKQQISGAGKDQEADGVQAWTRDHPTSTSVYPNEEFPPEIRDIYPKVKKPLTSGPDAIAIDPVEREITVMDITSKPTPEHVAKTLRDADLLKSHLPERFQGYRVFAQEGWYDGGLKFSPRNER